MADPAHFRGDLPKIGVAALFEEHCSKLATPLHYANCVKVSEERRRAFFEAEMKSTIFAAENFVPWLNRLLAWHLHLHEVQVYVSQSETGDIFSPVHLIVDALVSVYVLPLCLLSNCVGASLRDRGVFAFPRRVLPRGEFAGMRMSVDREDGVDDLGS
jgi:hypothetical protein